MSESKEQIEHIRDITRPRSGGIIITDGAIAQTGIDDTPVKITGFQSNTHHHGIDGDHSNNRILTTKEGDHLVMAQLSFSGTVNQEVTIEVYADGQPTGVKTERKLGTGGDVGSASITGLVHLDENAEIDIRVNSSGPTIEITASQLQFNIFSFS
jgi:hypothetical protein